MEISLLLSATEILPMREIWKAHTAFGLSNAAAAVLVDCLLLLVVVVGAVAARTSNGRISIGFLLLSAFGAVLVMGQLLAFRYLDTTWVNDAWYQSMRASEPFDNHGQSSVGRVSALLPCPEC